MRPGRRRIDTRKPRHETQSSPGRGVERTKPQLQGPSAAVGTAGFCGLKTKRAGGAREPTRPNSSRRGRKGGGADVGRGSAVLGRIAAMWCHCYDPQRCALSAIALCGGWIAVIPHYYVVSLLCQRCFPLLWIAVIPHYYVVSLLGQRCFPLLWIAVRPRCSVLVVPLLGWAVAALLSIAVGWN
jgi:hypothetical protein